MSLQILFWLPKNLPPHIHIIVSTRTEDAASVKVLIEEHSFETLHVSCLGDAERETLGKVNVLLHGKYFNFCNLLASKFGEFLSYTFLYGMFFPQVFADLTSSESRVQLALTRISCVSYRVYIRLCKHSCDVTAYFPVLFYWTIRLRAPNFYEVILRRAEARVNYRFIEIESE